MEHNTKIVAVSMIRNGGVMTESFVRYTLSFSDMLIVFDHNSTDGTAEVLNALETEAGGKLVLYKHSRPVGVEYSQAEITNSMLREAFGKYGADFVLPLDADEFPLLTGEGGVSLRDRLHSLSPDRCYRVNWLPFAPPAEGEPDGKSFFPLAFTVCRSRHYSLLPKCIVSRRCFDEDGLTLPMGNHALYTAAGGEYGNIADLSPEICYAHYPCLSRESMVIKTVHGWLACLASQEWAPGVAASYKKIYDRVAAGEQIDNDLAGDFCLRLGEFSGEPGGEPEAFAVEVKPECLFPDIQLRYGSMIKEKQSFLRSLMQGAEELAEQCRISAGEEIRLRQRLEELQQEKKSAAASSGEEPVLDYSLVFDSGYYLENNADVAEAVGGDPEAAFQHFLKYGMDERREASPTFSVGVYREKYTDIAEAYGDDIRSCYMHYMKFGFREGRRAAPSRVSSGTSEENV